MLDLDSETVISSEHGIFTVFRSNFRVSIMVPMRVLSHPRRDTCKRHTEKDGNKPPRVPLVGRMRHNTGQWIGQEIQNS